MEGLQGRDGRDMVKDSGGAGGYGCGGWRSFSGIGGQAVECGCLEVGRWGGVLEWVWEWLGVRERMLLGVDGDGDGEGERRLSWVLFDGGAL